MGGRVKIINKFWIILLNFMSGCEIEGERISFLGIQEENLKNFR